MTSNLSLILKKYTVPTLFFVIGCVMLYIAISQEQGLVFTIAAFMMLIAGILSIGFSTGNIKSGLVYVLGIIAGIGGLVAVAMSYSSVKTTLTYQNNARECAALATQNLQDIRYIQKSYKEKTGKYIGDWNEFVEFTKNGTVPFLESIGSVPSEKLTDEENRYLYTGNPPIDNDMTEEEAYLLSLWTEGPRYEELFKNFKRDTIQKSLKDVKFGTKSYIANREKLGFYKFTPDSLPIIPHTNQKWSIETKDSVKIGDESFPTIRVEGRIPYGTKKEGFMYFGSISLDELGGSWEE
ncbi:MAG: hypothetical protein COA33_000115 [Fluviicola sp.]|nr:hypothetical protein [Fluviicola sp.]